ncbi:MAG: hypothetical protein R3255_10920 [Candidatus Lokiarchaeia archaeon]|nr:hypothetical protein [Candidatus Lokiarchaeia archaeon]
MVMNEKSEIIEIQGTADGATFTKEELAKIIELRNRIIERKEIYYNTYFSLIYLNHYLIFIDSK